MDGVELKAWREARGLSQVAAAKAQGTSESAWQYYETGKRPIPPALAASLTGQPIRAAPKVASPAKVLAKAEGAPVLALESVAFDPIAAGLRPYPRSNTQWGASINFDTRKVLSPWKRVPGCCRVVNEAIPDPIPFYPPAWAGDRGVPTADGRVFDYETGRLMRDFRGVGAPVQRGPIPGSRLKVVGKPAKR